MKTHNPFLYHAHVVSTNTRQLARESLVNVDHASVSAVLRDSGVEAVGVTPTPDLRYGHPVCLVSNIDRMLTGKLDDVDNVLEHLECAVRV